MKNIVLVDFLTEYGSNRDFGILGRDIDTNDFLYYTHFDKKGHYKGEKYLRRFNQNNSEELQEVKDSFFLSFGGRQNQLNKNLSFLNPILDTLSKEHFLYNIKMGYPIDDLINNKKNLAAITSMEQQLGKYMAEYLTLDNTISLAALIFQKFNTYDEEKKQKCVKILLHELGHMKVSHIKHNKNNSININSGFIRTTFKRKTIKSKEHDNIIFLQERISNPKEVILEEIFNDLECSEIIKDYEFGYPKYGALLDSMSNGNLRKARYNEGIDAYYQMFEDNYGTIGEANQLLDLMAESFQNKDCEQKSFQLLKKYAISKK